MSTAALPAPHPSAPGPDTMDYHSEDGLGFDDGDVDIDFDLRSAGVADDDESLRDAGTDAGQDMQTVPGDLDDFMADNEDIIEEDIADIDVEVDLHTHPAVHATTLDHSPPPGSEEDLIDYSDDEGEVVVGSTVATDVPQIDVVDESAIAGHNSGVNNVSLHGSHAGKDDRKPQQATMPYEAQTDLGSVHSQDLDTTQQPSDAPAQPDEQSQPVVPDDLETSGQTAHTSGRELSDATVSSTAAGIDNSSIKLGEQDDGGANFHPVNVNFSGKDYWLFQHHDYEGSGDYLLEDEKFLKQPLNSVINACREALDALEVDIPGDFELGFCLDSLHHVELFEEHSTCAFFSLHDILHVYLQLHAQDGIADPEYFCISLVSRPRVSSLLAELSRAATEGIGYSGLDNVISSGQSLFSIQKSHSPTEYSPGNREEDDAQEAFEVQHHTEAQEQDGYMVEQEENVQKDIQASYGEQGLGDEHWQQESSGKQHPLESEPGATADISGEYATTPISARGDATSGPTIVSANEHVQQPITDTAVFEQSPLGPEENFLDYSDDEYDGDVPDVQAQGSRVSSTSTTIQGDDPSQIQVHADEVAQDGQMREHVIGSSVDNQATSGDDAIAEYEGNDDSPGHIHAQGGGEAYEEDYEQEYGEYQEAESYPGYGVAHAGMEDTNQLGDLEQQVAEDDDDLDLTAELHVAESDAVDDATEGLNDHSEFGNTIAPPQRTLDHDGAEDELDYSDDEEDGVVGQALAAASAAADTVATSSIDPPNLSPQGQKRTIDEVGNDVGDATTPTDAKRPRV